MNEKAIFEIGNLIHMRYKGSYNPLKWFRGEKLKPEEIIKTFDYKLFKKYNPELCRLAENEQP